MAIHEPVLRDNECLGALCTCGLKGLFYIVQVLHLQGLDAHTHHAGGGFDFLEISRTRGVVLRREVADPCNAWERFFQQC